MFYNGLAGVLAAVLRAITSFGFGLILFIRLDRLLLMKGFESFDKGNSLCIIKKQMSIIINVYLQDIKRTLDSFTWITATTML